MKKESNIFLILNAGSSSIKFQLFRSHGKKEEAFCRGIAERIGIDGAIKIDFSGKSEKKTLALPNHSIAIREILSLLRDCDLIKNFSEIAGVGHRIVHGGPKFTRAVLATPKIIETIREMISLAPLHNPGHIAVIDAIKKIVSAPNVFCFDTSFHRTIPELNRIYPTPFSWYEKYRVEKYGFHGISYDFVVQKLQKITEKKAINAVICHLGNGSSVAAIKDGRSINTSMGFTPLAGLMMGTRCGDIDPSIIEYISKETKRSLAEVSNDLNTRSGLLGVSGITSDMREIAEHAEKGNKRAQLAADIYAQRVANRIAEYANLIGKELTHIVFTGGIGENNQYTLKNIIKRIKILCFELKNKPFVNFLSKIKDNGFSFLTKEGSNKINLVIIKTNEELMICRRLRVLIEK